MHPMATYSSTLSLHDALPISSPRIACRPFRAPARWPRFRPCSAIVPAPTRSEEHTSELQSPYELVCRPLLEKKHYLNKVQKTVTSSAQRKVNVHDPF